MPYAPAEDRYDRMVYRRCGRSGLKLPAVSLGLWHNFGSDTPHDVKRAMCRTAFDLGVTSHARGKVTSQDTLSQRVFDPALDRALERPRAIHRVIANRDLFLQSLIAELQFQFAFGVTTATSWRSPSRRLSSEAAV